jgi:seryl-tRNA synthetase
MSNLGEYSTEEINELVRSMKQARAELKKWEAYQPTAEELQKGKNYKANELAAIKGKIAHLSTEIYQAEEALDQKLYHLEETLRKVQMSVKPFKILLDILYNVEQTADKDEGQQTLTEVLDTVAFVYREKIDPLLVGLDSYSAQLENALIQLREA